MSRKAVFDALIADETLNDLGVTADPKTLFQNWSSETRPIDKLFVILRWGNTPRPIFQDKDQKVIYPPTLLKTWVHLPLGNTNDSTKLVAVLDAMEDVLRQLEEVDGSDGYTICSVGIGGRSEDYIDDGFNTMCKNADFEILMRRSDYEEGS